MQSRYLLQLRALAAATSAYSSKNVHRYAEGLHRLEASLSRPAGLAHTSLRLGSQLAVCNECAAHNGYTHLTQ